MRFTILASPIDDVVLIPYEEGAFPKFSQLFEIPSPSSRLRFLALDPDDAATALVLENSSARAITALSYRWVMTDASGKERTHAVTSDSYMVDVYRPVVAPGARQLITRSGSVDEVMMDHLLAGGGGIVAGSASRRSDREAVELTFALDFILFEDGEIAGPDPNHYGTTLQCRKRGAEFIAKQIRLAEAESRDVTPVLSALVDIPHLGSLHHEQGDRLVQWTRYYARDYLSHVRDHPTPGINWPQAMLRHLENRPDIPRFYRRGQ